MENNFLFTVLPINNVDAALVGREEEIEKIKSALDRYQNISIIGDAKIGKSSILKSLEEIIKSDERYKNFIPVYIDLEKFSYNLQTDKLLEKILKSIYNQHAELREEHSDYAYSKHDEFSEVVEYCNYNKLTVLLLLDNFDNITVLNNLSEDFFSFLRGNAIEKGLSIITASRSKLETLCHKGKIAGSQFWNIFNPIITLSLFEDNDSAKNLLSYGIKDESMQEMIISNVGLHPCYLSVAANAVLYEGIEDTEDKKIIEEVLYKALLPYFQRCVKLLKIDEDNIDNGKHYKLEYLSLLNLIANQADISEYVNKREYINLKQLGYISEDSNKNVVIFSPLFAKYIMEITRKPEAYSGDKPFIFISYAHADKEEVMEVLQRLMNEGYRFWFDEGIEPGTEWRSELTDAIKNSNCFLVFISKRSMQSEYVLKEVRWAAKQKKEIIQLYLEDAYLPEQIEFEIGNTQGIKKYENADNFYHKLFSIIGTESKS